MASIAQVKAFLQENGARYHGLLGAIRDTCDEVAATLGPGIVRAVYGRAEKQKKTSLVEKAFKDPVKIAKATVGLKEIAELQDIIGLTMVVHYPDQVALVDGRIVALLDDNRRRIRLADRRERRDKGYYATHLVFKSDHSDHRHLFCEVQIKTMLHDAWAAKTHDLTYKPQGPFDSRLDRMMAVFAESLQGIELLSQMLRDMIEEKWAAESRWREFLRRIMFDSIPDAVKGRMSAGGARIRSRLKANRKRLSKGADIPWVEDIAADIECLAATQAREAYLLEASLAMLTDRPQDRQRAEQRALQWLAIAPNEYRAKRAKESDIWSVPLILQACGNLEKAIESSEAILDQAAMTPEILHVVSFNLADFLTEQACVQLPVDPTEQAAVRAQIEALVVAARPLEAQDPAAFADLEGMIEVAFSQEASVLRDAIRLIERGNKGVPQADSDVAQAYFEVHARLAWRRLLEAEARDALSARR